MKKDMYVGNASLRAAGTALSRGSPYPEGRQSKKDSFHSENESFFDELPGRKACLSVRS